MTAVADKCDPAKKTQAVRIIKQFDGSPRFKTGVASRSMLTYINVQDWSRVSQF